MPMQQGEDDIVRKTLRIELKMIQKSRAAIDHHDLDDFHAYVRMLIRRDIKKLTRDGIIPKK